MDMTINVNIERGQKMIRSNQGSCSQNKFFCSVVSVFTGFATIMIHLASIMLSLPSKKQKQSDYLKPKNALKLWVDILIDTVIVIFMQ